MLATHLGVFAHWSPESHATERAYVRGDRCNAEISLERLQRRDSLRNLSCRQNSSLLPNSR